MSHAHYVSMSARFFVNRYCWPSTSILLAINVIFVNRYYWPSTFLCEQVLLAINVILAINVYIIVPPVSPSLRVRVSQAGGQVERAVAWCRGTDKLEL